MSHRPQRKTRRSTRRLRQALAAVYVLLTLACGSDGTGPEMERLAEQRALWEAQGLTDYFYDVRLVCFCPSRLGVQVSVLGNQVAAVIDLDTGTTLDATEAQLYRTIDGLFDVLEDAYERDAYDVDVDFDPARGYPTRIFIDYLENVIDEELGYTLLGEVQVSGD